MKHRNVQDMQEAVRRVLRNIPAEDFETALMSMPIRWMKCVEVGGEYFEGRHLTFDPADHGIEIFFGEDSDSDNTSSDQGEQSDSQDSE